MTPQPPEENGERDLGRWEDEQLLKLNRDLEDGERELSDRQDDELRALNKNLEDTERDLSEREEKELAQLKAEYEADTRELVPEEIEDLKKLEEEYKRDQQRTETKYEDERRYVKRYNTQQKERIISQFNRQALRLKADYQLEQTDLRIKTQKKLEQIKKGIREGITPEPLQKIPTVKPTLIIARTPYPKWWKDSKAWPITIIDAGTHIIIDKTPGWFSYISTIVLTVSGETNLTFNLGIFGSSGPMDFGGENEPRGMVIAMGNSPLPCGEGGFSITSDGAGILVSGFIVYYYERVKET